MKLAISNIAWKEEEDSKILPRLHAWGIEGIEVAPNRLFVSPTSITKSQATKQKLLYKSNKTPIIAMQALLFGHPELELFPNPQVRENLSCYLKKIIKLGSYLSAKALVFGSPKNRQIGNLSPSKANRIAIKFFHELATYSHANHTVFCLEPNSKEYNCDFLTTTQETFQFIINHKSTGLGLNCDTGVMILNKENYLETLKLITPQISHFHVSLPYLNSFAASDAPLAEHKKIASALRQINYNGWISIEMKPHETKNFNLIKKSIDLVQKIYLT